ncbi:PREDICTED: citrate synthase 1, peroxisomal-like [Camelina sativa]|uniref:Citrate synthase n=1 Tax=Camelina sativa TaxID=90675 RepID=A0ABM1QDV7_CAMSA|nr:PREDICTED: citrate synthase 1, peroxisomal-like [Camelina sativa]
MEKANARLAVLSAHLEVSDTVGLEEVFSAIKPWCTSAHTSAALHGSLKGNLTIVDERTGKKYQVPVSEHGTVKSVDLKKITTGKGDKGLKLYDPGYVNTAPVRSSISTTNGEEGTLRYRGYPIEELAEKSTYTEVTYLLIYGNLPSKSQLADWQFAISQNSVVPQGVLDIIQCMPQEVHPIGALVTGMSALSIFYPEANPSLMGQGIYKSKELRDKQIVRILGQAPTIAVAAYLRKLGMPPVQPLSNLSFGENFLYMVKSMGNKSYRPNPRLARVLDVIFILHAEHEMNCSTAAARHLASSGVDVYTAVAGGVGAIYGPLHGGAVEATVNMLTEIGSVENIPGFIESVKNRKRMLFGFGHRIYRNYDPRGKIVKKLANEVFSIVGREPLTEVADALEKAALSDEYFIKRKLYPNVDFYTGLIYRAMGIPSSFIAAVRIAGYLAHWRESLDDPETKIMRPQQVYNGVWLRHYQPLRERAK